MSINTIQAPFQPQANFSFGRLADRAPASARRAEIAPVKREVEYDQLSLGEARNLQVSDESRSIANLRFRSRLQIKQNEDGTTEFKLKSRLKFNYEFQSEDGTTIKVSAKLKTKISYTPTREGGFELKARVKFEISAARKTVETSLAPAIDSVDGSADQRSTISAALQQFGTAVDGVTDQFLNEAIQGDDLIGSLVNIFNELTGLVQPALNEGSPDTTPIEATLPQPLPAEFENPSPPIVVPQSKPPIIDVIPTAVEDQGNVVSDPVSDEPVVRPVGDDGVTVNDDAVPAEESLEGVAESPAAETPIPQSSFDRRTVLVDLRVKFVQSLSRVISIVDPPSDDASGSSISTRISQRSRLDIRLSAYSQAEDLRQFQPGIGVDTQV